MPTVRDFLDALKFERWAGRDEGSCFGVTDPSRLRPAFQEAHELPPVSLICAGCKSGDPHVCSKHVEGVQRIVTDEEADVVIFEPVLCQCEVCNK